MDMVELLKKIYANPELAFEHLHPDFKLHSPGHSQIAGTFHGAEATRKHLEHMDELSAGSFNHDVHEAYLADENWGMVVHCMEGERNGVKLDMWGFGIWRFKDGLLIDHWEHVADPELWDRFWS